MNAIRIVAVPAALVVAIVVYVALNPGGTTVATPNATPTEQPTRTPAPTSTPLPPPVLPDGVSGRLTYRTGLDLVTVQLPGVVELARTKQTFDVATEKAANGAWWLEWTCNAGCQIQALSDGVTHFSAEYAGIMASEWSPSRSRVAAAVQGVDGRFQVVLIEGDSAPSLRVLSESPDTSVVALAWLDDSRLLLSTETHGAAALHIADMSGSVTYVADLATAATWFYPSRDRSRFLYTQSNKDGWRLHMLDVDGMTTTDLGNMGSDPAGTSPPIESADNGKGSIYIAWSPDGTRIAFGGGFEPPYFMTTVDLVTGAKVRTQFPSGYPGEIKWSHDGSKIAVSTYDIERTHHETWVVDPVTGAGRHLMDGCVIVWSPDGRFLAVHGEDVAGISIVDVVTGERGQLTHRADDVPVEWAP